MNNIHETKPFLSVGETQSYLGCSRSFVYKLIKVRKLPPYKVEKRTYLKYEDVNSLFKLSDGIQLLSE